MPDVTASPFFRPTEKPDFTQTPRGTLHRRRKPKREEEAKSTVLGCSANLINAIVGSGIVGLPYAIQQAGFVAGIGLIVTCALLTEKSLRLLVETAKHVHVPSYETVAEAAFGRFGFLFVAINMFMNAYGAMLSYLMILKDSFSMILGVSPDDDYMRRAILFIISITIIVPLSSQRVSLLCRNSSLSERRAGPHSSAQIISLIGYGQFGKDITNECIVRFLHSGVSLVLRPYSRSLGNLRLETIHNQCGYHFRRARGSFLRLCLPAFFLYHCGIIGKSN